MALLQFQQGIPYYLDKAISLMTENKFIKAITFLRTAAKLQKDEKSDDSIGIQLLIAKCYNELELFDSSIDVTLKLLAKKLDIGAEGYFELIRSYASNDNLIQSAYYLKEARIRNLITDGENELFPFSIDEIDFSEFDFDYDSDGQDLKALFGGADSYNRSENIMGIKIYDPLSMQATIEIAKTLYESCADKTFAKQVFESVPQSSTSYSDACAGLTLVALSELDPLAALKYVEKANLSRSTYLCVKMIAYNMLNQTDKVEASFNELLAEDIFELEDVIEVYYTLESINRSDFVCAFADITLDDVSYEYKDVYLICAQAYYNIGKQDKSIELSVNLVALYPDDFVVNYYSRRAFGKFTEEDMPLTHTVPKDCLDVYKWSLKNIFKKEKDNKILERFFSEWEIHRDAVYIAFQCENSIEYQAEIMSKIARLAFWEEYVRDMLLKPLPEMIVKEALVNLLQTCKNKNFTLKKNEILKFYTPKKPYSPPLFCNAYWMTYTSLCLMENTFERKLNATFKEIVIKLSCVENLDISDNCLAAIIAFKSACSPLYKKKSSCCEIFGAKMTEFNKYFVFIKSK